MSVSLLSSEFEGDAVKCGLVDISYISHANDI